MEFCAKKFLYPLFVLHYICDDARLRPNEGTRESMEARRNLLGGSYHRSSASNAYLFEMERHDLVRGKMSKYNSTVL